MLSQRSPFTKRKPLLFPALASCAQLPPVFLGV